MTTRLIFTVDTEVSPDDSLDTPDRKIWGRTDDGRELGITYIMDALGRRGWSGTFFLSVFEAEQWGEQPIADIARAIAKRGFDVELHTHLEFDNDGRKSYLSSYTKDEQAAFIRRGKALIEKWTGTTPRWHRAGHLGANEDTIAACLAEGLHDSSFAFGWPACQDLRSASNDRNSLRSTRGVLELPLTTFRTLPGLNHFRVLDINNCVLDELTTTVREAVSAGVPHLCLLMHSFSFMWRDGDNRFGERRRDLRRFERFLDFCRDLPGLEVVPLSSVEPHQEAPGEVDLQTGFVPTYKNALLNFRQSRKNMAIAAFPLGVLAASQLLSRLRS